MNDRGGRTLLLLAVLLIPSRFAFAHHPPAGFGPGMAGPILTIPPLPMDANRWSGAIRADYQKFDRFSDTELETLAASGAETHSMDDQTSIFFSAGYGLTGDLSIGMHVPYVVRRGIREGHFDAGIPEVHNHGNSEGIGDLSVVAQYRLLRMEKAGADVSSLFGLKAPTGNTRVADRNGVRFETEFQPGSGSWDPLIGAAAGRRLGPVSVGASALYAHAGKGAQNTDLGDAVHFGLSFSWQHTPAHTDSPGSGHAAHHSHVAFDLILEAIGEWRQKQAVSGIRDPNSGGTTMLLAPGIRANIHDRFSAFLSAGFPVIQELNGRQHETRYRLTFGFSVGL